MEKLLDLLKIFFNPKGYLAIALLSGLLLFVPPLTLALGIIGLVEQYRVFVGLIFLCAVVLLFVELIALIFSALGNNFVTKSILKQRINYLSRLTYDEKAILRYYFHQQTKTQLLKMNDGVVNGLVNIGVLFRASQISSTPFDAFIFPFNINNDVYEYLSNHLNLIDIDNPEMYNPKEISSMSDSMVTGLEQRSRWRRY